MKHKLLKKITALFVVLAISIEFSAPALAAVVQDQNGTISIVDANGNVLDSKSQEDWEEAYPYGALAFKETQVNLKEGDSNGKEKGTLTLYRLGGTEGRAEALVTLIPAAAQIEEGRISYANAAGTQDYTVTVEAPWPCAQYQALGGAGEVIRAGGTIRTETSTETAAGNEAHPIEEETPEAEETPANATTLTGEHQPEETPGMNEPPASEDTTPEESEVLTTKTLTAPVKNADSYQWQMQIKRADSYVKGWSDVDGATEAEMVMSPELLEAVMGDLDTYDFRCFYEVNGIKYCTDSWRGEAYVSESVEIPAEMPEGFVDDHTRKDILSVFEGKEYDSYSFPVVFADGEWEKEITFEALDDKLHESGEVVSVVVTESRGAEVYSNACTASVAIEDNEPEIPSAMGFAEMEIWADKAEGTVRIPLTRKSEGLQYVAGVDYETTDGTARAGTDYAIGSGTALFASDLDYTYIEIDLINDGVELKKEDSELYFTVKLTAAKGGGGSTLIEEKTTVTVRLYNLAEGAGKTNLATDLYSPDEEDLTGAVESTSAIVPAGGSLIAKNVDTGENAAGEYSVDGTTSKGISTFSYTYPGALTFNNAHGGSFWTDNAQLANENVSGNSGAQIASEADDLEGYVSNASSRWSTGSRYKSTGWQYSTEKGGEMRMTVPNLYDRYSSATVSTNTKSDKSSWINGSDDWSLPEFSAAGNDAWVPLNKNPGGNTWQFTSVQRNTEDGENRLWFTQHYTGGWPNGNANCQIQLANGYLARRTIKAPTVRIHTADDDYLQAKAASLHETIKPDISLAAGKGGATADGSKLYNNSQVRVTRGANASAYTFATQANGQLSNQSLFFGPENASNRYPNAASNIASDSGTLTLLMPGAKTSREQGYINAVMDRQQTFSLEIAPSVPRLSENDSTAIDPGQIAGTWNNLWAKSQRNGGVTYTYREVNWDFSGGKDGFSNEKTGTLTQSSFKENNSLFKTGNLKNVRSINFHLDADDMLLVNGIAYAGNENIPIPANLYLNNNITLYYYDADYVTGENTMLTTISRVERYIDLNDDGVVKGTVSPDTGEFVPADGETIWNETTNTGTYYVLPALTEESYSISQLAPRLGADGKYHQTVLKVYYSMLPRSLVVPAGASSSDTAEVIPAVVTAVTAAAARSTMSDEQLGYRYIDHSETGSGKLMYEAKAAAISTVDIPLGGDFRPAKIEGETVTWSPEWKGNPYPGTAFADPQPIYLNGTVLGDRYAVGEVTDSGELTVDGKSKVANYLSSMQENDTFTLCVRETPKSTTRGLSAEPVQYLPGVESSRLADTATYPTSTGARNLTDPSESKEANFDSSKAESPMSEYDMGGGINLPELELGISDFVTISTNGQEMAISIGANIFGLGMESDLGNQKNKSFGDAETNSLSDANEDAIESVKQAYNSFFKKRDPNTGRSEGYKDAMDDYLKKLDSALASKGDDCITSKGFEVGLAVSVTLMLKWDPIENRFFFNQLMVLFAASLEFSYTVYLTPCPIFYCCVTMGFGVEVAAGLEASRVKVMAESKNLIGSDVGSESGWTYYEKQEHMGYDEMDGPEAKDFLVGSPGSSFTYATKEKAIDIYFSGTLYVEAVGKQPEGFSPGTIRSAGDEAVTIKLAKKVDGKDNSQNYTLKFTVVNDGKTRNYNDDKVYKKLESGHAIVDRIVAIDRQTNDVYFSGITISPEAALEVAVGVNLVVVKAEVFINVTVGCSFAIFAHDSADYDGEEAEDHKFVFNEFSLVAGVGFRVAVMFFKFEFNAVQFCITYDRETKYDEDTHKKSGWNFMWYAANQQVGSYGRRGADNVLEVNIILPGDLQQDEHIYSPEENLPPDITPFAFNPSDKSVPFQYSGYGSTGDAFALGSGLASGSTYELITAGDENYIVYTVSDGTGINQSQLVLSKVQETAKVDGENEGTGDTAYGLVHPTDDKSGAKYLKLDSDQTGDLDFDVWVDDSGKIHVAWVSYTEDALAAYDDALNDGDAIDAMEAAGRNTKVKTVTVDVSTGGSGKGEVKAVSDDTEGHGMYFMPSGAGEMVFYAEACYYTDDELKALLDSYKEYYGTTNYGQNSNGLYYGEDDPTVNYQMTMKRMRAEVYGKSFYPTFVVPSTESYAISKVAAQDWIDNGVQIENASLVQVGNDYYAAYNTAQAKLTDLEDDEQTIKKIYLQKLTLNEEGKAVPGSAVALRKLVDSAKDNSGDGVYAGGSLDTEYRDPYFANVQFLNGKLGGLVGKEENFEEQINMTSSRRAEGAEAFLIFEMNSNTYVVPEESLKSITDETATERKGSIIPFFTRETAKELNGSGDSSVEGAPAVTNATFGADGNGNITAVYTRGENGAPGNAVYLTKYDAQSQTWGLGTRLALRDMDTIEEAEAKGWSAKETAAAYYDVNDDGKADDHDDPASFTFNRLRIGLAGDDKLLIVAEGSLMALEAAPQMRATYAENGTLTGLAEQKDEEGEKVYSFQPKKTSGSYDTTNGVYALSFGMGSQGIGSAALYLSNYDLTPGSTMNASASFVNSGDVAIRASEKQPATITMYAGNEPLTSWQLTENVRAGQEVCTQFTFVTMPAGLKTGDKLYFTVNEDTAYIGVNGFSQSTITAEGEADTAGCITVANRVELGYESFDITMVGAGEDTVTLATDIHVGNRGSATSDKTYLRFQYEKVNSKGETELYPVDLNGHKLSVSNEIPIIRRSANERTLSNGYLLLRTTQDGKEAEDATKAGQIQSMYGRTVTGTFTVPKDWYDTNYGTGSLNLRVTIESDTTDGNENTEYNADNNVKLHSVEPDTLFTTVSSVNAQVGSTLRLPLTMQTSTKTAPTVTVTELTDDGSRNLSVLYYDVNQGAVVVMPGMAGEGKIRVADTATNSFHDICYQIEGEGVALNIYEDNGIFTWYNASGDGGESGRSAWDFKKALVWSEDVPTAPLRSDLAVAYMDQYFSFQTLADSINLYFMGSDTTTPVEIEVSSNLSGFGTKTYSSANGTVPVTITFDNKESIAHTITIRAKSSEIRFDKLEETFSESLNIQSDPTAPGVYWSRTLPKSASIQQGGTLNLTAYFADLGGLVSVTMNGADVSDQLKKDGNELWALPLTITGNGSYRFVVTDTAGNTTTRDLSADWFSATKPVNPDPGAPDITAQLTTADGNPIPATVPGDMQVMLKVTGGADTAIQAAISQYQYDDPKSPTTQSFVPCENMESNIEFYPVLRGIYRAAVRDESTGITSYRFVNLNERDSNAPVVSLSKNADGTALLYAAEKFASGSDEMTQIANIKLNGLELLKSNERGYRFSGSLNLTHGGSYILTATDEAGNSGSSGEVEVEPFPILLPKSAISITKVTEQTTTDEKGQPVYTSNHDGKITIDLSRITGGTYDRAASIAAGKVTGNYQIALLPMTGKEPPAPDKNTEWSTEGKFSGLDAGAYALYVRDINATDIATEPIILTVEFQRVIIHDVETTYGPNGSITVTATGGTGKMEYAIYNLDLEASGKLTINNHDTPDDDRDDTVDTVQADGTTSSRLLWQEVNMLTQLPTGKYIVKVRDFLEHDNCMEREAHISNRPSGGDFGGGAAETKIVLEQPEHGTISFSPSNASEGKTVTITVVPHEGYAVQSVTVTGKDGKTIPVISLGDGKYSFTMPAAAVTIAATLANVTTFADVPADAYYANAVNWAVSNEVTTGTSATTFGPNLSCTRAQTVTFLWRAMGSPEPTTTVNPFTDVDESAYYYQSVLWAVEQGVTKGTSDTTFSPNATVIRGQTVTFLYRAAGSPAVAAEVTFTDVPTDAYYAKAMAWAGKKGITKGTSETTFSPHAECIRAQMVTFLFRQFKK